jgi:hypothetical protein
VLAWSQGPTTKSSDPSWQAFLPEFEEALNRFVNGDATVLKQLASRSSDATIMGGWGAYEKGWNEVSARYDWASGRLAKSGAKLNVEYLTAVVTAHLAYTVTIERSEVRLVDQDKRSPMALRAHPSFPQRERQLEASASTCRSPDRQNGTYYCPPEVMPRCSKCAFGRLNGD